MEVRTFIKVDENLELRQLKESDAINIFETAKANFEHLKPFVHWVKPDYLLEDAKQFIENADKGLEEKKNQSFGIFYKQQFIGSVGFVILNWKNKRGEIGYWIDKKFEGQGIITKSCKLLLDYGFSELKLNRIEIHCSTENIRSRSIPEKLNFKLEGILRQHKYHQNKFYDVAVYAMLAEEWN